MLLGGDETGRTQRGNNNAYCQDNEISWFDWSSADTTLLEFTRRLIQFRKQHPVFRRRGWFQGRPIHGAKVTDIGWFTNKPLPEEEEPLCKPGDKIPVESRSVKVLRRVA
jgi:isoamylase